MIKKIPAERLRVGMYVHDINCGWLDHPFLLNQIAIRDEQVLRRVLRTGTRELYIDTERGLDVAAEVPVEGIKTREQVERELLSELHRVIAEAPARPKHVPVHEELVYARATAKEARRVVTTVMHSLRAGRQFVLEEVEDVVEQMAESVLRNPHALFGLTRIREMDHYTFEHSVSVSVFLLAFARELELDEKVVRDLGVGGLLHDIGKTQVPLEILNKPARLTEDEFAVMRQHVRFGQELLERRGGLSATSLAVVAEHHERHDGNGYPKGLKGDEISLFGQMASIVDVYDANTSDRCYHHGEIPTRVLGQLLEWGPHHFNLQLVHRFIRSVGIWPVGSLVRLRNDWLAVIIEQGAGDLLHPRVRAIYDAAARQFIPPRDLDLAAAGSEELAIVGAVAERAWGIRAGDYL
jgi:putative nucleotidyltransferase with HDIG domain